MFTEKAVLRAVSESNYGREHIVPSIVQLGFVFLESVEEISIKELGNSGLMGFQELVIQMLKSLFEVGDMARNERLMGVKMATFKLHLICRWSPEDFEVYQEGLEGSDIESS